MNFLSDRSLVEAVINQTYAGAEISSLNPYTFSGQDYNLPQNEKAVFIGYLHPPTAAMVLEISTRGSQIEHGGVALPLPVIFDTLNLYGNYIQFIGWRVLLDSAIISPNTPESYLYWTPATSYVDEFPIDRLHVFNAGLPAPAYTKADNQEMYFWVTQDSNNAVIYGSVNIPYTALSVDPSPRWGAFPGDPDGALLEWLLNEFLELSSSTPPETIADIQSGMVSGYGIEVLAGTTVTIAISQDFSFAPYWPANDTGENKKVHLKFSNKIRE